MQRLSPRDANKVYSLLQTPQKEGSFFSSHSTRPQPQLRFCSFVIFRGTTAVILMLVSVCVLRGFDSQKFKAWQPLSKSRKQRFPRLVGTDAIRPTTTRNKTFLLQEQGNLSDTAFRGILKQFRLTMERPEYEVWLPLVLRDDKMFIARKHWLGLKKHRRFQVFTAMMLKALAMTSLHQLSGDDGETIFRLKNFSNERRQRNAIPLLMTLGDHKSCERTKFPRFGWCTTSDKTCTNFALPTYSVYKEAPETSYNATWFHETSEQRYPWSTKKAQVVWRGSATGPPVKNWYDLPRAQLVNYSIHHPDLFDGAFAHARQFKNQLPDEESKLRQHSRFAEFIKFEDFQQYRAVVDIDGNSWSSRFGRLLCMNSAVIKVQPANENYFYRQLQPWVHYIPVAADMSNMMEALVFATSNETQDQVRSIVYSANEFCRTQLTKESMANDIVTTLNSYVRLLGMDAKRWQLWREVLEEYERRMDLVEAKVDEL